jgi:inosose dehydratase
MKLAAAPISWGVCEVPDWGLQLDAERVLSDMRGLGVTATEAGPPGFLPSDAAAARRLLESRGLRLVGGFVTAVLHLADRRTAELAAVAAQADLLAAGGSEVLVLAPAMARAGYTAANRLSATEWRALYEGVDRVAEIASERGLAIAVHPHWGTAIERADDIARFLEGCEHPLCLDTGHITLAGADPLQVARDAGARVRHVHLKDVDAGLAAQVRDGTLAYADGIRRGLFRVLGEGAARIADVIAHLRRSGYRGWYVLEQDVMLDAVPPPGSPEWIVRSADYAWAHA